MEKLQVLRTRRLSTSYIRVGDQIEIPLTTLGNFTATAHKVTNDKVLFIFDECVSFQPMNDKYSTETTFEQSYLKKWMDDVLPQSFPDYLKGRVSELSIPSVGEIFGYDEPINFCGSIDKDNDEHLDLMKENPRYRIASNRIDSTNRTLSQNTYWLRNSSREIIHDFIPSWVDSNRLERVPECYCFACALDKDTVFTFPAFKHKGVRPEFWLVR